MSRETLREPFFENLWPLILKTNRCQVYSKNTTSFFEPAQNFDYIAAHNYLANKGYKNYTLPVEIRCFKTEPATTTLPAQMSSSCSTLPYAKKPEIILESSSISSNVTDPSSTLVIEPKQKRLCRSATWGKNRQHALRNLSRNRISCIKALRAERNLIKEQQVFDQDCLDELQQVEDDWQSRLDNNNTSEAAEPEASTAYDIIPQYSPCVLDVNSKRATLTRDLCGKVLIDFLERQRPWYKDEPWQMNENLLIYLHMHYQPHMFERHLLNAFFAHNCKCLLIDLPLNVGISEMQRWQYLCGLFPVIVVTRFDNLQRQVELLGVNFHALKIEENHSWSWQKELRCSLNAGFRYAAEHKYIKYCADNLIFLYAANRFYCTCDTFRVICKH